MDRGVGPVTAGQDAVEAGRRLARQLRQSSSAADSSMGVKDIEQREICPAFLCFYNSSMTCGVCSFFFAALLTPSRRRAALSIAGWSTPRHEPSLRLPASPCSPCHITLACASVPIRPSFPPLPRPKSPVRAGHRSGLAQRVPPLTPFGQPSSRAPRTPPRQPSSRLARAACGTAAARRA